MVENPNSFNAREWIKLIDLKLLMVDQVLLLSIYL